MGPSCWFKMVVRGAASAAVQLRVCISCELLMHMSNDKHFHTAGYGVYYHTFSSRALSDNGQQHGTYNGYAVKASGNDLVICALTGFAKVLHYQ